MLTLTPTGLVTQFIALIWKLFDNLSRLRGRWPANRSFEKDRLAHALRRMRERSCNFIRRQRFLRDILRGLHSVKRPGQGSVTLSYVHERRAALSHPLVREHGAGAIEDREKPKTRMS